MISQRLQDAFNKQIVNEMFSSNLYLSMAANFEAANLPGMAHWMKIQAKEELGHAMKFFDYIVDRGGRVKIGALEAPQQEWPTPIAAFDAAYKHELKISANINDLVEIAETEKDYAAGVFLQWFLGEQVEEESNALKIVEQLKMAGDSKGTLMVIDHHLGKRE